MNKSTALNQVIRMLSLTAAYIEAGDADRILASLSIVAEIMEENEISPSDVEALVVQNEVDEDTDSEQEMPSLRERVEQMLSHVQAA